MRQLLVAIAACLLLTGCAHDVADDLAGAYTATAPTHPHHH